MSHRTVNWVRIQLLVVTALFTSPAVGQDGLANLVGKVEIDGSSTVAPISMAVADAFAVKCPKVSVPVLISGTGGGFKRFVIGEIDVSDASRPIKKAERESARTNGVEFHEVPVAYDGLTIVVHPANDWAKTLTIDQIKKIFRADSAAKKWSDVDPAWPAREIKVFSPGTDSGTFDYFKEVVAADGAIRDDMSVSEDDNTLVLGVSQTPDAIGFFGIAYFVENKDKLKAVPVVNPKSGQPVSPTNETITSGEYAPFSRPLFIYVNAKSLRRPEVRVFVEFYLQKAAELSAKVGYVPLPQDAYGRATQIVKDRKTGTCFIDASGNPIHGPLLEVYHADKLIE
jgi:phosphate transport system substrate-binding protein